MEKIKNNLLFIITLLLTAFAGKFVHAASECISSSGGYCVNLAGVAYAQGIPGLEFLKATNDFGELISNIYVFGMGLVAISALVVLVAAGVWYMSAGDNAGRAGEAKKWMGNAIFGLVLALLSWLILYTINPDLVTKPSWVQNLQKINDAPATDSTVFKNTAELGPGTPPGAMVDCVISGGGTVTLTKKECNANKGSSTGGDSVPPQATVDCIINGKTFSITKALCDASGGSFPIGGGATNLGNGFTCRNNGSCSSGFCNASKKCAPVSSAPPSAGGPVTSGNSSKNDPRCTPNPCPPPTSCSVAVGQTTGTCNE